MGADDKVSNPLNDPNARKVTAHSNHVEPPPSSLGGLVFYLYLSLSRTILAYLVRNVILLPSATVITTGALVVTD